jgi:hypothetical protein
MRTKAIRKCDADPARAIDPHMNWRDADIDRRHA